MSANPAGAAAGISRAADWGTFRFRRFRRGLPAFCRSQAPVQPPGALLFREEHRRGRAAGICEGGAVPGWRGRTKKTACGPGETLAGRGAGPIQPRPLRRSRRKNSQADLAQPHRGSIKNRIRAKRGRRRIASAAPPFCLQERPLIAVAYTVDPAVFHCRYAPPQKWAFSSWHNFSAAAGFSALYFYCALR